MAQFCVASVPLTPWVTVYCHPIRSSAWIEMIMYSVALICKSYSFFSDSAVIVLVKNSIPGRLLFYITAIQETFGDTLTSELFAIFAVNPVVVIELKSTKALTLPYLYISEPLRMQHRTVGIFENGFLKVISIFNILFAGMVTNSLNPACRLLFYRRKLQL